MPPNSVADQVITQWQPDIATADSNRPITSVDYMNQGSPEDLTANQRVWRSTFRSEGTNKGWERWLNINTPYSPNPTPPVYASANSFTLTGDWTSATANYPAIAVVGRRIKATVTAGTVYGTITSAAFAGATTLITAVMDAGQNLDSGLTEVQFGVLASAIPGSVETQNNAPTFTTITNGGAGTAFTGTLTPAITAYVTGKLYAFLWTQASQGGDTIALNGLAAVPVQKWVLGALVALIAGDVPAGAIGVFLYDGTVFDLQTVFSTGIVTNAAKTSVGVPVSVGHGGTVGYDTWQTIASITLDIQNTMDLTQLFANMTGVLTSMQQNGTGSDEYDIQVIDQASNILYGPVSNIQQTTTTSSLTFGGVVVATWITPGSTGSNTFSLQIKAHNGSANNAFVVTINTSKFWGYELLK